MHLVAACSEAVACSASLGCGAAAAQSCELCLDMALLLHGLCDPGASAVSWSTTPCSYHSSPSPCKQVPPEVDLDRQLHRLVHGSHVQCA